VTVADGTVPIADAPTARWSGQGLGTAGTAPSGPELFARYAFAPNHLGLCGPDDWRSLLELGTAGGDDRGLRRLAAGFEGAYPYLELIARETGIADPLDQRVVEAYWLGTSLTAGVTPTALSASLVERFRSRVPDQEWPWLADKPRRGARAVHAFHVLDVFPRVGLLRGGSVADVVRVMDACRIRWGTVIEVGGASLVVSTMHLELRDGRLTLGAPRIEEVTRWLDGRGFVGEVTPGSVVSIHWDWACDRLSARQLRALIATTGRHLALANQTI
jgi:hypothetical protein